MLCLYACPLCLLPPVSGVLFPLGSSSSRRDTSELTLGEHKFALVHVRPSAAGPSSHAHATSASAAAVAGYLRSGGQIFPAIALPMDEGSGAGTVAPSPAHGADDDHEAGEEERAHSRASAAAARDVRPLAKQQSFQLYETSTRAAEAHQAAATSANSSLPRALQPSPVVNFIRSCQRLYSSLSSTLSSFPAQFVPYSSSATPSLSPANLLAQEAVVRAMDVHPTLPQVALLVHDQVHCYNVFPAASIGVGATASTTNAGIAPSLTLGLDRAAIVPGTWVPRTLRHPLMACACSVAFCAPGGNLIAVGTELGVLCLWQLVSVPAAASGHAAASAAASLGGGGGGGLGGSSARRMGAWLHVLHHPALQDLPLSHVAFSPCGRWLAVGSRVSSVFVIFDVSAALSLSGSQGNGDGASVASAGVPIQKLFSGLFEPHHGLDVLSWSSSGDRLLVATSKRSQKFNLRTLVAVAANGVKNLWQKATGERANGMRNKRLLNVDVDSDEAAATSISAAPSAKSLPTGTLTVWDTSSWTHQSWSTAAPVSSAVWSSPTTTQGGSFSSQAGVGLAGAASATAAPATLLLVALQGSSVIQSLHLPSPLPTYFRGSAASVASSSSSLANASVRIDCRPVEGLPSSRQPSSSDPDAPLEKFMVGGRSVRTMAWSSGGARLAVAFDSSAPLPPAAPSSRGEQPDVQEDEEEGSPDLVALFALNRDRGTETFQVLAVGMIRGPGCDCGGRVHKIPKSEQTNIKQPKPQHASKKPRTNDNNEEEELERKYDNDEESTVAADSSSTTEQSIYPSLHDDDSHAKRSSSHPQPLVCTERNLPVHLAFLNVASPAGELLVVNWRFGQTTFVPMYFAK